MPFPYIHPPRCYHMSSHQFEITHEDLLTASSLTSLMSDLARRLRAEEERLGRLVPDAPAGYHWEADTEYSEDLLRDEYRYRVVYRLKENVDGDAQETGTSHMEEWFNRPRIHRSISGEEGLEGH